MYWIVQFPNLLQVVCECYQIFKERQSLLNKHRRKRSHFTIEVQYTLNNRQDFFYRNDSLPWTFLSSSACIVSSKQQEYIYIEIFLFEHVRTTIV